MRIRFLGGTLVILAAAECAHEPLVGPEESGRPELAVVGTYPATAVVGTTLTVAVQLAGIQQVNGQVVSWIVRSGNGSVYAPASVTAKPNSGLGAGLQGVASNQWTLGSTAGFQTLEARLIDATTGNLLSLGTLSITAVPGAIAGITWVFSGASLSGQVGTAVQYPPVARVVDLRGNAIAGVTVTFAVVRGGGSLTGATAITGSTGLASPSSWTLGTVADTNGIVASATGAGSAGAFTVIGLAGPATQLVTGQRLFSPQVGTVITPVARVTDTFGNAVASVPVTFTVRTGGGDMDGVATVAAITDASGNARANWRVGPGVASNTLQATAPGLQGNPLTFVAISYGCDCWSSLAPMPTPRRNFGNGVLNGKIYTVAGTSIGGSSPTYLAINEVYDPGSNTWSVGANVPQGYAFPSSGVISSSSDALYLASGFLGGMKNWVQSYEATSNQWTSRAPIPTPRIEGSAAVIGNIFYVAGGDLTGNANTTTVVEAYNPTTDTWTTRAPLPTPRWWTATGVINNRMYVVGGSTGAPLHQPLLRLDVYDPVVDAWTQAAPPPTSHYASGAAVVNNLLYVFGGWGPNMLSTVEVYDPATDVWVTRASMPTARGNPEALVVNGNVYVIGGQDITGAQILGVNEMYQP